MDHNAFNVGARSDHEVIRYSNSKSYQTLTMSALSRHLLDKISSVNQSLQSASSILISETLRI